MSECSSINDEENDDERMISATATTANADYDNEFDEDYDDEFEDDDFDEYLSMKYDNKFNKASANSRSLMPNTFSKQMNPAKSKGKHFCHVLGLRFLWWRFDSKTSHHLWENL